MSIKIDPYVLTFTLSLTEKDNGVFVVELPRKQLLITEQNKNFWKTAFTNSINEKATPVLFKFVFADKERSYARFKALKLLIEKPDIKLVK